MKNHILLFLFLLAVGTLRAQTILHTEGFETNGEGTRYNSNSYTDCVNSDYFFRTNSNPVTPPACGATFGSTLTNLQGSFFWASEDIRSSSPVPNSRPPGQITLQPVSVTGYSALSVSLFLATSNNNSARWESADSINIQASFNGVTYFTVGRFMGKGTPIVGARLGIDGNLDGVYNASDPSTDCDVTNFTQYTFSIPGTGSSLYLRLDFDQLGGTEELAIDQIVISGTSTLPVKLQYFNGRTSGNLDILNWKVSDPEEAAFFNLEKSVDGINYLPVKTLPAGTNDIYETATEIREPGYRLYRLKIMEKSGREIRSGIVKLGVSHSISNLKVLQSSFGSGPVMLSIHSPQEIPARLNIIGMDGLIISERTMLLLKGNTILPLPRLSGGVYLIRVVNNDGQELGRTRYLIAG